MKADLKLNDRVFVITNIGRDKYRVVEFSVADVLINHEAWVHNGELLIVYKATRLDCDDVIYLPTEQRFISWFLRREDAEHNLAISTRWYIE